MTQTFDLAVLGAGSAGYACALRAAQLGLRVALIDHSALGGTCLHRGCIPAKAWLQAAKVRRTVAKAHQFGISAQLGATTASDIASYAKGVIDPLHRGLEGLISSRDITVVAQRGRLVIDGDGPTIATDTEALRAQAVVLATGAAPITLGLPVDGTHILTSAQALRLEQLPNRAIVVGGGVIGVEFASLWTDLGVEVTLVEATDNLLPGEEPAHTRILVGELRRRGVDVRLGVTVEDVHATENGVTAMVGGASLDADLLLVAVGRRPATADLGLEEAGIRVAATGHVEVDEKLNVGVPGVFAGGDIVAGPQLAHRGYAHGYFLAEHIAHTQGRYGSRPTLARDVDIPRITYSSPQVASVGLTVEAAGADAEAATYPLVGNGRARILRGIGERETGAVQVVRRPTGEIVGVHIVGDDVAELIAEGALLVGWQATVDDVAGIAHPHPTLGEGIAEAAWSLGGRALHLHD